MVTQTSLSVRTVHRTTVRPRGAIRPRDGLRLSSDIRAPPAAPRPTGSDRPYGRRTGCASWRSTVPE
ncbi:hypothetical protein SSP35_03_03530 [Streptomyces sp. NBRC 110611]|nr:hypothetical protein SSP35_03_03530 [Streptomyces sp. NBRC 110611]